LKVRNWPGRYAKWPASASAGSSTIEQASGVSRTTSTTWRR
jgi:hypothetical protein